MAICKCCGVEFKVTTWGGANRCDYCRMNCTRLRHTLRK